MFVTEAQGNETKGTVMKIIKQCKREKNKFRRKGKFSKVAKVEGTRSEFRRKANESILNRNQGTNDKCRA